MKTSDFTTTFLVDQTPTEAFDAINNVRGWWTENVDGSTEKLNDVFTALFATTWKTFKIIEAVPGKKVVWLVIDGYANIKPRSEWLDTKVSFEIFEQTGKTQVRFIHFGLTPQLDCFDNCSNAWTGYINNSLRCLITTGKGMPDKKENMSKATTDNLK